MLLVSTDQIILNVREKKLGQERKYLGINESLEVFLFFLSPGICIFLLLSCFPELFFVEIFLVSSLGGRGSLCLHCLHLFLIF